MVYALCARKRRHKHLLNAAEKGIDNARGQFTMPTPMESTKNTSRDNTLTYLLLGLMGLVLIIGALPRFYPDFAYNQFQTFVTIFMGIFIEAVPFLVLGSIVSGLIEVIVDKESLLRIIPRHVLGGAAVGALLGFIFPVCECGVVPVTRRLYQKGMPLSVGIAFLLAAPVINPIVIMATYTAFGWGPMLIGRILLTLLIAAIVGLLFALAKPADVLRPTTLEMTFSLHPHDDVGHEHEHEHETAVAHSRFWRAMVIAGDEFLDMARYLIVGSMLAAAMQTLVPRATLLTLGQGPTLSVVVLMIMAFVLSICSTVDSFVALSFVNTFTPGAILAFLVFGPMVDIKSALMFLGVFRRRAVVYLILLPLLLTLTLIVFINLYIGW